MATNGRVTYVNRLQDLRILVAQDEEGLQNYVVPNLYLGDVWWIPDDISGFGVKERHPWVVVNGYSPQRAYVIVCPRTTGIGAHSQGLITPAGILPELLQKGQFMLKHRRSFAADQFGQFDYIGRLPEVWIRKIGDFYRARATKRGTR